MLTHDNTIKSNKLIVTRVRSFYNPPTWITENVIKSFKTEKYNTGGSGYRITNAWGSLEGVLNVTKIGN